MQFPVGRFRKRSAKQPWPPKLIKHVFASDVGRRRECCKARRPNAIAEFSVTRSTTNASCRRSRCTSNAARLWTYKRPIEIATWANRRCGERRRRSRLPPHHICRWRTGPELSASKRGRRDAPLRRGGNARGPRHIDPVANASLPASIYRSASIPRFPAGRRARGNSPGRPRFTPASGFSAGFLSEGFFSTCANGGAGLSGFTTMKRPGSGGGSLATGSVATTMAG